MKKKYVFTLCLLSIVLLMIPGCSKNSTSTDKISETTATETIQDAASQLISEPINKSQTTDSQATEEPLKNNNEYVTETSWRAPYHYLFAVEREDCDCVKLQEGIYHFYSNKINEPGDQKTAAWEIHVTKDVINDIDALQNTDDTYQGFVGGENNEELTLILNKGYYVFIKSLHTENTMVTFEIKIEKIG